MDVERHKGQADRTGKPRFIWELEHAHTKAPTNKQAKPDSQAQPQPQLPVARAEQPKPARPGQPGRPRRRKALFSVFVALAVFGAGAFTAVELSGRGDTAKTGSNQAAELGGAEFPASGAPFAGASSAPTRISVVPTRRPSSSKSSSHHASTQSAEPAKSVAPAEVKTTSAPHTVATSRTSAAAAQPATTPTLPSVVEALAGQWNQCALLNGTCSVSLPSAVALGANGYFNYGTFGNATACTYSVFGNPNASGQVACYSEPTPTASSYVWTQCATENGTCSYSGVMTIAFGANGAYRYATLGGGGTACTDTVFGDPAYGSTKTCYLMAPPPQFTHWDLCATSGGSCKFSGTQEVAYGANGRYTYGSFTNGVSCTASDLGNPNASGTTHCYVQNYYQY